MKTITLLNIKGGVGKSATATTVSHMLADYFGKRVLLVDTDPQGNASSAFSSVNILSVLKNLLIGGEGEQKECTVEDLLLNSKMDVHSCIHETKYKNLSIIPALLTLSEAEERLKADIKTPQQFRLANHLEKLDKEYDYCIIDCSPSISLVNINALVASDVVYVPMKCDAWSGIGMSVARNLIFTVQAFNPKLQFGGCFYTQWEGNKNVSNLSNELLADNLGEKLLDVKIRKSKLIEEMTYLQSPLLEYDPKKKGEYSPVTKDYLKLTKYIMEH